MDKQYAISQMQYLARLFDEDSNFSNSERDQLAALAVQGGLSPEEAQQYSDGMVPPTYFANYQATLPGAQAAQTTTAANNAPQVNSASDNLIASNQPIVNVSGQDNGITIGDVDPSSYANSPATPPELQAPVVTPITPVQTPGMAGQDFFGNDLGALGFNDLNPIVTGAENTQQTAIPEFLKPFLASSANYSQGAMDSLGHILTQDNALVAPTNELQQEAQQLAVQMARGGGGYLEQAQDVFREVADGSDVVGLFDRAQNLLEAPGVLQNLEQMGYDSPLNQTAVDSLSQITQGTQSLDPTAQAALQATAGGDYLYGGDGFNAAVDAAVRKATPTINSNFALQGGAGALSGGLADAAIAEVTADAFARQYGQERANQLNAANQLNSFGLSNQSQQMGAAGLLGQLGLSGRGAQQSALGTALSGYQNAGNTYSNVANQERGRQIAAAGQLPTMGLLSSQLLGSVGAQQQAQDQAQRTGNVQQYQQLLSNSFGNINPNALFGNISSVQQNQNTGLSALGGALAGNELTTALGMTGPWGAIGGGLLGAFG